MIVVGDIDVKEVEAKIKSIWADVPKVENGKEKEKYSIVDFTEPRVGILTDKETTTPSIELYWQSDARDEALNSTAAGFSIDFIENIISSVMDERFTDITSKADSPFINASFGIGNLCEAFEATYGQVQLKEENILGGFAEFAVELEKMKRFGFTEAEVSRAKDKIIARLEKMANSAETRMNPEFVRPLINNFFDNEAYMEPSTELELAKALAQQISAQVLNQMVSQIIPENNLVVIYSGPEKEGIETPAADQLLAIIDAAKSAQIEAPAEEAASEPLMDPSTLKGTKVLKTAESIYGATEWTLKNGVKVVVLPTEYKKDQILFNLSKDGGLSLISDADVVSFDDNISAIFGNYQGISKFKGTELSKMLAGKNVSVRYYFDELRNGIQGNSSVKDLETAFQLIYLNFTDPRFDEEEWNSGTSQLNALLPNLMNNPSFVLSKALNETLYGNNPRMEFISSEKLAKASLATFEKNYRNLFKDAAGATMVIAGDVNIETLRPLVEKYIGSLPKGKKASSWKDAGVGFVKGRSINNLPTRMETPKSTVVQIYSDYSPYSVKNDVLASAVSYILDQIYVDTMREEEGGTYGASTSASARRIPTPRYVLQVAFECSPEMEEKLTNLAKDEFGKLAANGPTDDQFKRTVENFKKNIPEKRISNSYWLGNISTFYRSGYDYDKEYEAAVNSLTKEDIRQAARRLFDSGNFYQLSQNPEQAQ